MMNTLFPAQASSGFGGLMFAVLSEYVVPLGLIVLLFFVGRHLVRTSDNRPLNSPVNSAIAYSRDHPLATTMLAASAALSIVSFWNTWGGFSEILGNPFMAFFATVGIQGLMLVFAWKLGFDLFSRNGAAAAASVIFSAAAYASAMFLSSGFATVKIFDVLFNESERVLWSEIHTDGQLRELLDDLAAENEAAIAEVRREMEAEGSNWLQVVANIQRVNAAEQTLRAQLREQAEQARQDRLAQQQRAIELAGSLREAELQRDRFQVRVATLESKREELDESLDNWRATHGELKARVENLQRVIDDEIAGRRSSGLSGCGPECREKQKELRPLLEQYDSGPRQELERLEAELESSGAELEDARVNLSRANANVDSLSSERDITSDTTVDDDAGPDLAAMFERVGSAGGQLSDLAGRFYQTPTSEDYEALRSQCALLQTTVLDSESDADGCGLALIEANAQQLIALTEGNRFLESNCSPDQLADAKFDEQSTESRSVLRMTSLAETCLARAGLPASRTAGMRDDIINIKRNRSERAAKFSIIQTALGDGERLAWVSLGIAFLIDILVLFAALVGVLVMTDPMQRAGLTRNEATGVRNALRAISDVRAQDLANFILASQAGPSVTAKGFTRLDPTRVDQSDSAAFIGVIGAAYAAQYRRPNLSALLFRWTAMAAIAALTGWVFIGGWFGPAIGVGIVATLLLLQTRLAAYAESVEKRTAPKDENGDLLPRLVHMETDHDPSAEKRQIISISGIFLSALQIVADEEEDHKTRHRKAVKNWLRTNRTTPTRTKPKPRKQDEDGGEDES